MRGGNKSSVCSVLLAFFLVALQGQEARSQSPGIAGALSTSPAKAQAGAADKAASPDAPREKEKVAAPAGPIQVQRSVHDPDILRTLQGLLPKYPGVRSVKIQVDHGIVTLDGHVDDDDTADEVTRFTERVEGVRLVLNRLKTDSEVLSARQLAMQELRAYGDLFARKWVVGLVALGMVLLFLLLARLFDRYSETLLAPFVPNVLLRSVAGSFGSSCLAFAGLMLALSALNLTRAVLSIVGLAGVVGLAVGFAFRDIAENFIASLLLGVRRPFQIGDYIQVAGQAGVVRTLNTRATVLVTLEGHHVRIPNSVIFK
ncbi:MAG TPA: mechanosensitive ion channel domain-containing protein, partial [Isosphaeraceae bacterium]|nr:mechanosensitive ion channel domain-containing protein [Isosphaeraceae bacterium]